VTGWDGSLGIIDKAIDGYGPLMHVIVEAHPDVIKHIHQSGYAQCRDGIQLIAGKWQDNIEALVALSADGFDAVYFDTYLESYSDLHRFFTEALPRLLAKSGRFSYFNGLAPYNIFFHSVYSQLAARDLAELGFVADFTPIEVGLLGADTWRCVRRKYWQYAWYWLPSVGWNETGLAVGAASAEPVHADAADGADGSCGLLALDFETIRKDLLLCIGASSDSGSATPAVPSADEDTDNTCSENGGGGGGDDAEVSRRHSDSDHSGPAGRHLVFAEPLEPQAALPSHVS
jgi:hypothetical protein